MCVGMCMYVSADSHGGQKDILGPLKLEAQVVVSHPTTTLGSAGNWTYICYKSTKHSWLLSRLYPLCLVFFRIHANIPIWSRTASNTSCESSVLLQLYVRPLWSLLLVHLPVPHMSNNHNAKPRVCQDVTSPNIMLFTCLRAVLTEVSVSQ